jgi:DNA-binding NarL/FixJ family response regulator
MIIRSSSVDAAALSRMLEFKQCSKLATSCPATDSTTGNIRLVVIDLKIGPRDLGGLSLIRRIRFRDSRTQILVFSMHDNPALVTSALEAGASGYLLKDSSSEQLARAVS